MPSPSRVPHPAADAEFLSNKRVRPVNHNPIIIATRGSALALWQAKWIKKCLENVHPVRVEIRVVKTTGDKQPDVSLTASGTKGLFTKEIEEALLAGEADLAVHSLKDLPNDQPAGLRVAAFVEREDPRDVLIGGRGAALSDLPAGACIGTSSLRRQAQLRALRPDLVLREIRGNLDTRLRKLDRGNFDALVVAAAGMHRLSLQERITEYFSPARICPAVGQGTVAVEIRDGDSQTANLVQTLDHPPTRIITEAERTFLRRLGGGCRVPIAAYGRLENGHLHLAGMVATPSGDRLLRAARNGSASSPELVGTSLADDLLAQGAEEILKEVR